MNKLQQLQEEMEKEVIDKWNECNCNEGWDFGQCKIDNLYPLTIHKQALKKVVEYNKALIKKAFKLGQLSGIELSEECIPEEIKYIDPSGEKIYYQDNLAEQFNKCRTESLTNLSDLKKNIHGEA